MFFVFDTNVLISAALSKGTSRMAFELAGKKGKFCYSTETLFELVRILEKPGLQKFLTDKLKVEFLSSILSLSTHFTINEKVKVCRDPKDDMFLELALACDASVIVSGDKDLLQLNPFRGISIVSPDQFLQLVLK